MSLRDHAGINAGDPTRPRPLEGLACPPWMVAALCAQTDPEAFFPEKGGSVHAAKRVCGACPVRDQCLEWALVDTDSAAFGIYGGLTPRERRKVARDRAA